MSRLRNFVTAHVTPVKAGPERNISPKDAPARSRFASEGRVQSSLKFPSPLWGEGQDEGNPHPRSRISGFAPLPLRSLFYELWKWHFLALSLDRGRGWNWIPAFAGMTTRREQLRNFFIGEIGTWIR